MKNNDGTKQVLTKINFRILQLQLQQRAEKNATVPYLNK